MFSIATTETAPDEMTRQNASGALPPSMSRPYPPYAPSPVNRIVNAIRSAPVPAWLIYGTLATVLVGLELAIKWLDGTFPARFQLIHVMVPVYAMLILPALHYLDDVASKALATTRPLLTLDEPAYRILHYRITTLRASRVPIAAAGGLLALLLLLWVQPADSFTRLSMMTSPLSSIVEGSLLFCVWLGVGIFAYHSIHQLSLVNEIYTHYTRINLFTLGPLYAFSRLTASSAVYSAGVWVVTTVALASLAGTIQWAIFGGWGMLLAAATFVAPLWSAHRLLKDEKARQQDALGKRLEKTIALLQGRIDGADLAHIGDVKTALDGLIVAQKELNAISTWPWQPATLRGVATALLSPLIIWLITRFLERLEIF